MVNCCVITAAMVAASATICNAAPVDTIRSLDSKFNALYNAGNFNAVAALYNPGADLIPPTTDAFVKGTDAAPFFKQGAASGVTNLHLNPINVLAESDSLYHEIGNVTHALQPQGGLYYVRWFKPDGGPWQIALDILAIGSAWSPDRMPVKPETPTNVTMLIQGLDDKWATAFNAGDYDKVAGLYNPGAQIIAPGSSEFLKQSSLAEFLEKAAAGGLADVQLNPALTTQESPTLIHEIGTVRSSAGIGTYYVRWIKPADSWQVAFDIMSIGE